MSVDPIAVSRSLANQLRLGFPLLEDTGHQLGSAFGSFHLPSGMDMGPVDNHSIFVVDGAGHIAWKELAADTMHVPVSDVIRALQALRG